MTDAAAAEDSPIAAYGPDGEAKLRAFVETLVGGRVVEMTRQLRWRPAWFVEVDKAGETLRLYLRGDRQSDVLPFPELEREAHIMRILENHGVPCPHIYGYCEDPPAIVMALMPGDRDMSKAKDDAQRQAITRQYIEAVAAMHRLPLDPFVAKGLTRPESAADIGLAGLDAYLPLYAKTKNKPEPLVEFAIAWLRRNVPQHRTKASFIQFDSGQFLFEDGRMSGLYDFEFAMIGDAMTDLATMRMRESVEPLGDELRALIRHYEKVTGEPVDHAVIDYHTLLFSTVAVMQFAGTVARPQAGDPHATYFEWDLALRRSLLMALAACMEVELQLDDPPIEGAPLNRPFVAAIKDILGSIEGANELDLSRKSAALDLLECLERADEMGREVLRRDLDDVSALLGCRYADWSGAEAALESFVREAGPEWDGRLLRLFTAQQARKMQMFGPTSLGRAAVAVTLNPTR